MSEPPISPSLEQEPADFIRAQEDRLFALGASASERAFGAGCSAAMVPTALVLLVTYLFGNRSWAGLALALIIEILLGLALVNLFALRARKAALLRAAREVVLPEIEQYITLQNLTRAQIYQLAVRELPEDALLVSLFKNFIQE